MERVLRRRGYGLRGTIRDDRVDIDGRVVGGSLSRMPRLKLGFAALLLHDGLMRVGLRILRMVWARSSFVVYDDEIWVTVGGGDASANESTAFLTCVLSCRQPRKLLPPP